MPRVLLISFDALGDDALPAMLEQPRFSAFADSATTVRGADSIFLTNTYPIHASIATGVRQAEHGVISNTQPEPVPHPVWNYASSSIHARTLWQAAREKGLRTAAVMWPATAYNKEIHYNVPEIVARPGKSQTLTSLFAGSPLVLMRHHLRYQERLRGIEQPFLDDYTSQCMADIIRRHHPDLMLMHLTAYDALRHRHGNDAALLQPAYASLEQSLARLLDVVDASTTVIIFSDHSQLDVHTGLLPNDWLVRRGLMDQKDGEYRITQRGCFFECCGGSAFLHGGNLAPDELEALRDMVQRQAGFGRFLSEDEMQQCGRATLPVGMAAALGYHFENRPSGEKATHGYPLDMPNYKVFYMARGAAFERGRVVQGGSIQDITALCARELGIEMRGLI